MRGHPSRGESRLASVHDLRPIRLPVPFVRLGELLGDVAETLPDDPQELPRDWTAEDVDDMKAIVEGVGSALGAWSRIAERRLKESEDAADGDK